MRFNLYFTYWSLFCVTLISSCFLFFVVASENAKYVAVAEEATIDGGATVSPTNDINDAESAGAADAPHERILPNYKKVKKLNEPHAAGVDIADAATAAADDDFNAAQRDLLYAEQTVDLEGLSEKEEQQVPPAASAADNVLPADALELTQNDAAEDLSHSEVVELSPVIETAAATTTAHEAVPAAQEPPALNADALDVAKQEIAASNNDALPDITEIPTITTGHEGIDLPLDILEPTLTGIDSLIIDVGTLGGGTAENNRTRELLAGGSSSEEMLKDEQIIKINDSGGDTAGTAVPPTADIPSINAEHIPDDTKLPAAIAGEQLLNATSMGTTPPTALPPTQQDQHPASPSQFTESPAAATTPPTITPNVAEEVPIPVFSEWAQKQMEAAEKQQQMEQDVVNSSTQRRHDSSNNNGGTGGGAGGSAGGGAGGGSGNKLPPLKLRAKNYASPDCGAKIIASNADASNTGAVLSASKDEYMLSPCTNRIWFVVELCEAIQAQKIDLANFELFSSSPRNFTVAVSNRFPTRDWSNVGRFIAEDKRTVQSFELHPHLFGKFVRVDIHSHYSKEHFCPVSLFRVFGTSEFEAFETENHPELHGNDDEFDDDEFANEFSNVENSNLFKSASDAVLSIVKKAAEVLKPSTQQTGATADALTPLCQTLAFAPFSCAECDSALVQRVNALLQCKSASLQQLLGIQRLRSDLLNTPICAQNFGVAPAAAETGAECDKNNNMSSMSRTPQSYLVPLLPAEYVGALCLLLAEPKASTLRRQLTQKQPTDDAEMALNLTIDKKLTADAEFKLEMSAEQKKQQQKLTKPTAATTVKLATHDKDAEQKLPETQLHKTAPDAQLTPAQIEESSLLATEAATATPPVAASTTTTAAATGTGTATTQQQQQNQQQQPEQDVVAKDVNIFNVNIDDELLQENKVALPSVVAPKDSDNVAAAYEGSADYAHNVISTGSNSPTAAPTTMPTTTSAEMQAGSTEDPSSWDSIDHLLTATTVSPPAANNNQGSNGGGAAATGGFGNNGVNMQQKIPNGPHSESIFIRLSNRIKALERNMSLSGQYLEELSRRYKKQVEDLQQTLTQQTHNVRTLEEQNRRHGEYEQLLSQRNLELKDELDDLMLQVHACIVVIIFVGTFIFLVLMVGILFIRAMRRETRELVAMQGGRRKSNATLPAAATAAAAAAATQRKLNRRKSFEDFSDHQQALHKNGISANGEKQRRPSEEAMLILKDCAGDAKVGGAGGGGCEQVGDARQRKISVCYGSSNSISSSTNNTNNLTHVGGKRKGEKHSWPNSAQTQQQLRQQLQLLGCSTEAGVQDLRRQQQQQIVANNKPKQHQQQQQLTNGAAALAVANKSKKKTQNIRRLLSADNYAATTATATAITPATHLFEPLLGSSSDYDESLMLDEDDLDNFLPGADLAYNEFMPDGPSGYQISTTAPTSPTAATAPTAVAALTPAVATAPKSEKSGKKTRRLSSPAFFKSPFSKGHSSSSTSSSKAKSPSKPPAHESTSWEWYRSKKSELRASTSDSFAPALRRSPAVSIDDSSSLSEINFPTNSNENSFRILEEAILLSSTNGGGSHGQGNGNAAAAGGNGSSSGGSSSLRSSSTASSSTTKKKNKRSFNKIFRKVF